MLFSLGFIVSRVFDRIQSRLATTFCRRKFASFYDTDLQKRNFIRHDDSRLLNVFFPFNPVSCYVFVEVFSEFSESCIADRRQ